MGRHGGWLQAPIFQLLFSIGGAAAHFWGKKAKNPREWGVSPILSLAWVVLSGMEGERVASHHRRKSE